MKVRLAFLWFIIAISNVHAKIELPLPIQQAAQNLVEPRYSLVFGRKDTEYEQHVPAMNIYLLDVAHSREIKLTSNSLEGVLEPAPNGKSILFGAFLPEETARCGDYCIMDIYEKEIRPAPSSIDMPMSISWSPDSHYILYSSLYVEPAGVYILDLETNETRLFSETKTLSRVAYPSWSPNGRYIAIMYYESFLHIREVSSGKYTGGNLSNRKYAFSGDEPVVWSPDSTAVVFTGVGVFLADVRLKNVRSLTPEARDIYPIYDYFQPAWSPDGKKLVLSLYSYEDQKQYIETLDIETLERIRLAEGSAPKWSPDGEWIVFLAYSSSSRSIDIYLVRPDGSGLMQVTDTSSDELDVRWVASGN